jgi:hypothetical protein
MEGTENMVIQKGLNVELTVICSEAEPDVVLYGVGKMLLVKVRAK